MLPDGTLYGTLAAWREYISALGGYRYSTASFLSESSLSSIVGYLRRQYKGELPDPQQHGLRVNPTVTNLASELLSEEPEHIDPSGPLRYWLESQTGKPNNEIRHCTHVVAMCALSGREIEREHCGRD